MGHKSNQELAQRVASLETPPQRWPRWIVSGGGPGFLRPAPGSWGTAAPAAVMWILMANGARQATWTAVLLAIGAVASLLLVIYGKWAAAYYREPDPGTVVLDEYAGFAVTALVVPVPPWCAAHGAPGAFAYVAGLYILFRATDTLKLPPANWLERLPWGWGVLCDDLAAGVQANLIAQAVVRLLLR
ncbi:MAG TPA: phosphatidylglycerophosphatase A [Phycisphaerae bacterium]|nr:phosphatidylglycerophosphatase A [Phycisphaerae bacterium]